MGACIDQFKYFTFTVFESPFEKVADIVRKGWGGSGKYTITDVPFSFNLYEECPLNGGAHMEKAYFYAPESSRNQCVMFSNYADGLSSWAYQITASLKIKAYLFRISTDDYAEAMNAFSLIEDGKNLRTVYAMRDPKWTFYCQGEALPFEDGRQYQRRIIKQRLNKDVLISYCAWLGYDIAGDLFWKSSQSILLERIVW